MEASPPSSPVSATASHPRSASRSVWYWWLVAVSTIGTLDIAQFLASNSGMFSSAPSRAAGSVLGLICWVGLTALAGLAAIGHRPSWLRHSLLALAVLVAVGSLGLTAIHAAAHVGGLRPALGGVISLIALGLTVVALRRPA
ncbi:MAG: hypothetical protein ACRENX_06585 [Candidatus Dormibacteria bacterium]